MANKGFAMQIKNNAQSYTTLYPKTSREQILGWNIGEVSDLYTLTLRSTDWVGNKQTINLPNITAENRPYCLIILDGDKQTMLEQSAEYMALLSVNALDGQIEFVSSRQLRMDVQVQLWWTI